MANKCFWFVVLATVVLSACNSTQTTTSKPATKVVIKAATKPIKTDLTSAKFGAIFTSSGKQYQFISNASVHKAKTDNKTLIGGKANLYFYTDDTKNIQEDLTSCGYCTVVMNKSTSEFGLVAGEIVVSIGRAEAENLAQEIGQKLYRYYANLQQAYFKVEASQLLSVYELLKQSRASGVAISVVENIRVTNSSQLVN